MTERAGQQTCRRQQGCPCGDLPPSALEGGAHDSGRAWSSQGLLVAVHTWSSAARGATRKLQIINYLTKIRVVVFTTLKMPKSLITSGIRVAHPVSALPATNCEAPRAERVLAAVRDNINEERRGQKGRICTRCFNDGGRNPRFAHVKFNVKGDGGKKA